ncbi:hypothetical protein AB0M97_04885 [Streptomyces sp. NPDC051207]|uniref:hypothetical protein n=1 Tax=Streptomyces sp. NPDC051207 TaxID=3154641 RepID=UPI00341791AE
MQGRRHRPRRDTDDPLGRFLRVRGEVRAAVAAALSAAGFGHPRGGRGGHAHRGEH